MSALTEMEALRVGEMQEKFRRLHEALETHPGLTGMMTDDLQGWLADLVHRGWRAPGFVIPRRLTPTQGVYPGDDDVFAEGYEATP